MKTKYILINSYYSELDYSGIGSVTDGLYSVYYPVDMDIKKEIKKAYEELSEAEELTNELSCVLEYLIGQGKEIDYEQLDTVDFDCDYGKFDEE